MAPARHVDPRPGGDAGDRIDRMARYGAEDGGDRATMSRVKVHNQLTPGSDERDGPSKAESASIPSPNRQADKIKSLLASYYAVDGDADAEVEEIQPADDDGAAHDARPGQSDSGGHDDPVSTSPQVLKDGSLYRGDPPPSGAELIAQIKSNQRLDDLLTTERELATDIGNADIELRGVVYDSYCSFIKASETVKNLHTALHDVDASLHRLDSLMSSVAETSESIDRRLNAQQKIIFEMHEKRMVTQGVEALLKVDERIREEMDAGDYEQVVRLYRNSIDALNVYKEHEKVERVRRNVLELRGRAVEQLRQRMRGQRHDRNALGMLVGLGEAPEGLLEEYVGMVLEGLRSIEADEVSAWDALGDAQAACRGVISMEFCDRIGVKSERQGHKEHGNHETQETQETQANHENSRASACVRVVDSFVASAVEHIASRAVDRALEKVMAALYAAGGFDVAETEHLNSEEHQHRESYAPALSAMFETFDSVLQRAQGVDAAQAGIGASVNTTDISHPNDRATAPDKHLATHSVHRLIARALDRHVYASYAVVGARAFKSMKEMMMRLLLKEEDDVRFLRVLIKSLEVGAKQDFGLVEKTVEAWVAWDGCVSKLQVLESLDSSCRDMLKKVCDSVRDMVTALQGEPDIPEQPLETMTTTMATTMTTTDTRTLPAFLQKQFAVPAPLSEMDERAPVATLCLASSLTALRATVVDAEMNETAVASVVSSLTTQYADKMTTAVKNAVITSFQSTVLDQTATPPASPSKTALDIIHLVTQAKTDCANTNRPDTTLPEKLLTAAMTEVMNSTERSKPISKAAFQQIQVDMAVMKKRLSPDLRDILGGIVSRTAEHCGEPALVDPLTLERLAAS